MKTQDTNFNPKMSSEPLEEKPFLTEEDCDKAYEISPCTEAKDYYSGFLTAASKANARISELEKAIRLLLTGLKAENIDQLMLKAMPEDYLTYGKLYSNIAQDKISSLESELKALREERDKFAIEFLEYMWKNNPIAKKGTTATIFLEQFKAYTLNTEKTD